MIEPERKPSLIQRFFQIRIPLWIMLPFLAITLIFGMGGGFVGARQLTPATECPEAPEVCAEFATFWQVWDIASRNFVDANEVQSQDMIDNSINGMLNALGDEGHTRYLSADDAQRWAESIRAEFEGIGAYIDVREGQTVIVSPIEGSPAEAAGILAGDIILAVDGEDTTGWTVEELVANVRGPRGSTVTLTVLHPGESDPVDIDVTRDTINVPSVSWVMLPDDIAYLKLNSFSNRSADEIRAALVEIRAANARGLVFDLRDNPGGLVNEAMAIASQFLPPDTTVFLEEDRDGNRVPSKTVGDGLARDIPLVVLINGNSASSSEIVSGAIQAAGRASLVGMTTVGTGTVLTTFSLDNGGQLLLGTSQWLTPDGELIRREGIQPDIEIALDVDAVQLTPNGIEQMEAGEYEVNTDAQLQEAIKVLQDQIVAAE